MADASLVRNQLGALDTTARRIFGQIFEYVLANLRIGRPEDQERSENFQLYAYKAVTAGTANQEFSVPHGLGRTPYLLIPVLAVDKAGEKLVELHVSKSADATRVYLKSPVTNATVRFLLEA